MIVEQYSAAPHAGWLYLASTLMSRFGGKAGFSEPLVQLVRTMAEKTFALLRGGLPAFVQNPDIVEDLFRMVRRAGRAMLRLVALAG